MGGVLQMCNIYHKLPCNPTFCKEFLLVSITLFCYTSYKESKQKK